MLKDGDWKVGKVKVDASNGKDKPLTCRELLIKEPCPLEVYNLIKRKITERDEQWLSAVSLLKKKCSWLGSDHRDYMIDLIDECFNIKEEVTRMTKDTPLTDKDFKDIADWCIESHPKPVDGNRKFCEDISVLSAKRLLKEKIKNYIRVRRT